MQEPRNAATADPEVKRNAKVVVQTADVRIVEYVLGPGDGHPWHYHSEVSDRVYCLAGLIGMDIQQPAKGSYCGQAKAARSRPRQFIT